MHPEQTRIIIPIVSSAPALDCDPLVVGGWTRVEKIGGRPLWAGFCEHAAFEWERLVVLQAFDCPSVADAAQTITMVNTTTFLISPELSPLLFMVFRK